MNLLTKAHPPRVGVASSWALGAGLLLCLGIGGCGGSVVAGGGAVDTGTGTGSGGGAADAGTGAGGGDATDAGTGAGGGDAGTCGPMIGAEIHCQENLRACCVAQGGVPGDVCTSPLGCSTLAATCYPPLPPPANDEFACDYFNCKVGQVCVEPVVAGDGCWRHSCQTPPAPCDKTPTCACLLANKQLSSPIPPWGPMVTCAEDAAGNAHVKGNIVW